MCPWMSPSRALSPSPGGHGVPTQVTSRHIRGYKAITDELAVPPPWPSHLNKIIWGSKCRVCHLLAAWGLGFKGSCWGGWHTQLVLRSWHWAEHQDHHFPSCPSQYCLEQRMGIWLLATFCIILVLLITFLLPGCSITEHHTMPSYCTSNSQLGNTFSRQKCCFPPQLKSTFMGSGEAMCLWGISKENRSLWVVFLGFSCPRGKSSGAGGPGGHGSHCAPCTPTCSLQMIPSVTFNLGCDHRVWQTSHYWTNLRDWQFLVLLARSHAATHPHTLPHNKV